MKHIKKFELQIGIPDRPGTRHDMEDLINDIENLISDRVFELTGDTREFKTGPFAHGAYLALKEILGKIQLPESVTKVELH